MIEQYKKIVKTEFDKSLVNLDEVALVKARDLILAAHAKHGRVHVTGIGKPSYVAGYIASLLSSTGTPAYVLHGTEAVHGSSGQVLPQDVVIAISNSGQTAELKYTVETIQNIGCRVIAVTGNASSWLATAADVHLLAHVDQEGDDLNKAPRASILAETLVLQALSVCLQEAFKLDALTYLKWHPGGALGSSIRQEEHHES